MRRQTVFQVCLSILALPALLGILLLFNTVNPMTAVFVTQFDIVNATGNPLWVTPVGAKTDGTRRILPQYALRYPAIPALRGSRIYVRAGSKQRIIYDCD